MLLLENRGNTALSIFFANSSSFVKIIAPLTQRKVLCVVVVTTSQYGNGLGCKPVATNPAIWAISAAR